MLRLIASLLFFFTVAAHAAPERPRGAWPDEKRHAMHAAYDFIIGSHLQDDETLSPEAQRNARVGKVQLLGVNVNNLITCVAWNRYMARTSLSGSLHSQKGDQLANHLLALLSALHRHQVEVPSKEQLDQALVARLRYVEELNNAYYKGGGDPKAQEEWTARLRACEKEVTNANALEQRVQESQ